LAQGIKTHPPNRSQCIEFLQNEPRKAATFRGFLSPLVVTATSVRIQPAERNQAIPFVPPSGEANDSVRGGRSVQTCSVCNALSPDTATHCANCQADLTELSSAAVALKRFQANPRVRHVILQVMDNCCPTCAAAQGAYPKDQAPRLPVEGCSHELGCRCFYQPELSDIYP
jgi:hypothetical protein